MSRNSIVTRKDNHLAEKKESKKEEDVVYIFTPHITKEDGARVYAIQYGKKAFRIPKENR
jgi:hypothetical protein